MSGSGGGYYIVRHTDKFDEGFMGYTGRPIGKYPRQKPHLDDLRNQAKEIECRVEFIYQQIQKL